MEKENVDDQSSHNLLIRIDEKMKFVYQEITDIKNRLATNYVTQDEFRPVKNVVYGLVGAVLITLLSAGIAIVMKQG